MDLPLLTPWALNFLIFYSLHQDLNVAYGDYHMFWQVLGFCFPISGLLVFGISFCVCKEPEPFDHDVDAAFDENDIDGIGAESSMAAAMAGKDESSKNVTEMELVQSNA